MFGKDGTITSPGYPTEYLNNMECEWKIIVPKPSKVKITIIDFNTERVFFICFDYLEIM